MIGWNEPQARRNQPAEAGQKKNKTPEEQGGGAADPDRLCLEVKRKGGKEKLMVQP